MPGFARSVGAHPLSYYQHHFGLAQGLEVVAAQVNTLGGESCTNGINADIEFTYDFRNPLVNFCRSSALILNRNHNRSCCILLALQGNARHAYFGTQTLALQKLQCARSIVIFPFQYISIIAQCRWGVGSPFGLTAFYFSAQYFGIRSFFGQCRIRQIEGQRQSPTGDVVKNTVFKRCCGFKNAPNQAILLLFQRHYKGMIGLKSFTIYRYFAAQIVHFNVLTKQNFDQPIKSSMIISISKYVPQAGIIFGFLNAILEKSLLVFQQLLF